MKSITPLIAFMIMLLHCAWRVPCNAEGAPKHDTERRPAFGVSIGLVRPMNEAAYSNNQKIGTDYSFFALYRHAFGPHFTPEFRLGSTTNESRDTAVYSSYKTGITTMDIRVRWHPFTIAYVQPYASIGLGLLLPSNEFPRTFNDPTFRKNNAALVFLPEHSILCPLPLPWTSTQGGCSVLPMT